MGNRIQLQEVIAQGRQTIRRQLLLQLLVYLGIGFPREEPVHHSGQVQTRSTHQDGLNPALL
jgi:hypothetical protein